MNAMKLVRKRASARFDAVTETTATDTHLELINRLIPEGFDRATAEDVHVRSALACNDQVDHYSTRFTLEALQEIVALINGSDTGINLMRNHNEYGSGDLPIGRLFAAELVTIGSVNHVRVWFYWERGTEDGDEMARKIALAIWREVSISWWMRSYVNSIDGKPIKDSYYPLNCPGEQTPDGQTVIGIMSGIEQINELSIVPRGGQKSTAIQPARAYEEHEEDDVEGLILSARRLGMARTSTEDESALGLEHLFRNDTGTTQVWFMSMSGSS